MPKGDRYNLKADPEDGTTPVAHLLLEAISVAKLSGTEKGILTYLWRNTYGWNFNGHRLKSKPISIPEWQEVLAIKDRGQLSRLLAGLEKQHIINREFCGAGKGYIYSTNTHIYEWNSGCLDHERLKRVAKLIDEGGVVKSQQLTKKSTVDKNSNSTVDKKVNPLLTKKSTDVDKKVNPIMPDKESIKESFKRNVKKEPFEKNLGEIHQKLTDQKIPFQNDRVETAARIYGFDKVNNAINNAIENGKNNWGHIATILREISPKQKNERV